MRPWKGFRDIGILAKYLFANFFQGYGLIFKIFEGIYETMDIRGTVVAFYQPAVLRFVKSSLLAIV